MNKKLDAKILMQTRILEAAIPAFADLGYNGASTREIAKRAGISQGLLTYHFKNKRLLWFAAAKHFMDGMQDQLTREIFKPGFVVSRETIEQSIVKFLRFTSNNPYFLKFVIDGGVVLNERTEFLVDNYVSHVYGNFSAFLGVTVDKQFLPSLFYAVMGACAFLFSVPAEAKHLTGIDATSDQAIETHAMVIAAMFFPALEALSSSQG